MMFPIDIFNHVLSFPRRNHQNLIVVAVNSFSLVDVHAFLNTAFRVLLRYVAKGPRPAEKCQPYVTTFFCVRHIRIPLRVGLAKVDVTKSFKKLERLALQSSRRVWVGLEWSYHSVLLGPFWGCRVSA